MTGQRDLRGLTVSVADLARLTSRFSLRVSFGSFLALALRGDFPDIAMHASLLQLA